MPTQTVTRSVESDLEPAKLYNVLAEPSNIPKWAPVFADAIERIDHIHHRVTRNGEVFNLEVSVHPSAVAVDYTREMPNGKRGGACIRVTSRPLGGCTITMTVPVELVGGCRATSSGPPLTNGGSSVSHGLFTLRRNSKVHFRF